MGEIVNSFQSIEGFVIDFFGQEFDPMFYNTQNLQQLFIYMHESSPKLNECNSSSKTQAALLKKTSPY